MAFFVLLILSIVFASKNKKLMNQAKENTKKQKLVAKHYPTYDFALLYGFVGPIIFGGPLLFQTYGLTGGLVVLRLNLACYTASGYGFIISSKEGYAERSRR